MRWSHPDSDTSTACLTGAALCGSVWRDALEQVASVVFAAAVLADVDWHGSLLPVDDALEQVALLALHLSP